MKAICALVIVLTHILYAHAQTLKFVPPLKGENGKDYYLIYADNDLTKGIQDAYCGNNTYDGHEGTDFLIKSFKEMDTGVVVYAIADGEVIATKDGKYDRNKSWHTAGLGNYIEILHGDYNVYYGHLAKHSLLVRRGDKVNAGQPIAKIGSSGMSSNPHLHLQIHDGYSFVDAFGKCGPGREVLWAENIKYDTAVYVIENGLVPYVPGVDSLKERIAVRDTFYTGKDTVVSFWALAHGLQKDSKVRIAWYEPGREHVFNYKYDWQDDLWYDYAWSTEKMPLQKGRWEVEMYIDDKMVTSRWFYVE